MDRRLVVEAGGGEGEWEFGDLRSVWSSQACLEGPFICDLYFCLYLFPPSMIAWFLGTHRVSVWKMQ